MKKILAVLLISFSTLFLNACNDDEVRKASDNFMQTLISGKYEEAFNLTADSQNPNQTERVIAKGLFITKYSIINNLVSKPDNLKIIEIKNVEGKKDTKAVKYEVTNVDGEKKSTSNTILYLQKINDKWYVLDIK